MSLADILTKEFLEREYSAKRRTLNEIKKGEPFVFLKPSQKTG